MEKTFLKHFYTILNYFGMIIFLAVASLIVLFESSFNLTAIIVSLSIIVPFVILFFIFYKHTMTTVQITENSISIKLFSKILAVFNWDEFENIAFEYRFKAIPVAKFYKKDIYKPVIVFDITKKNLSILKNIENVSPIVRETIRKIEITKLGNFKKA